MPGASKTWSPSTATARSTSFRRAYPGLSSTRYDLERLDLDRALDGADLVLVHEWNDHELVRRIGEHRARSAAYRLLFHDTHHRCVTDEASMAPTICATTTACWRLARLCAMFICATGWTQAAWTWHEAGGHAPV
jgi:hypothetical protein